MREYGTACAVSADTTNTERASNLTSSQVGVELAVRLAEKESLTLFFTFGISLPTASQS